MEDDTYPAASEAILLDQPVRCNPIVLYNYTQRSGDDNQLLPCADALAVLMFGHIDQFKRAVPIAPSSMAS